MTESASDGTPFQKAVNGITGILIVICGIEMVPGWGLLGLDWSPAVFCLITAVAGAISGWVSRTNYRVPGLIAGAIAGPGAILAMYLLLQKAERVPIPIVLLAIFVGVLPAFACYKILAALQDAVLPPRSAKPGASRRVVEGKK